MKKTTLFFSLLFWGMFSFSQSAPKVKLTWGAFYQLPKKHFDAGFLGNLKDGFIQLSMAYGKDMTLQRFSPTLKLMSTKTIDLKSMPDDLMNERFLEWNGKTYWMYSTWDKKAKKESLSVQEININKGELQGKSKNLITCDKVLGSTVYTGFYRFSKADKFKISMSTDSTKLFVYVLYPHKTKIDAKSIEEYEFWVFDKNFSVIWNKKATVPYTEKKMDLVDVQGDRNGNFLFLAKVFNDDSRKEVKDEQPNFHYEILRFSDKESAAKSISFNFENRFVSQLSLIEDFQGRIVCSGFYSNKDRSGKLKNWQYKVDGSFFLRMNESGDGLENIHKGYYEIPSSVFKEYESAKTVKKLEKKEDKGEDLSNLTLHLRKVIFHSDGALTLVGEEYFMRVVVHSNGKYTYTTYHYYYNDVIVQHINAAGELVYTKKIPKSQHGVNNTLGLGVKVIAFNGIHYLLFLDNMKNLNLPVNEKPATHSAGMGGVLMAVRLDETGNMKKDKIFDIREVKEQIDILEADRVGPNTLISRTFDRKTGSRICLITME